MINELKNIVHGHANEIMGINTELKDIRMAICKACPLYLESNIGPLCNPNKYINPSTGEARYSEKDGYVKGCGCRLNAKTRLEDAHCPAKKW